MRTALLASQALGLNFTMDLPPDYTPLTLSEGFYMATMGGAEGTLSTEFHKKKVSVVWNWGEPERAPHSHVLKMSVCAILKVCVVLGPLWYRGSCCVVERCGVMWRSWVRVSQRQLLFFLTSILHVCWKCTDNVFIYLFVFCATKTIMGTTWLLHEYTYLLWIDYEYQIECVQHSLSNTTNLKLQTERRWAMNLKLQAAHRHQPEAQGSAHS